MVLYSDGWLNYRTFGFSVVDSEKNILVRREYPVKNSVTDTCNTAEYLGVINAFNIARKGDTIYSDSELVVQQINGNWKINYYHLKILCGSARSILKEKNLTLKWISRNSNLAGLFNENKLFDFNESYIKDYKEIYPNLLIPILSADIENYDKNTGKIIKKEDFNKKINKIKKDIKNKNKKEKQNKFKNNKNINQIASLLTLSLNSLNKTEENIDILLAKDLIKDSIKLLLES